MSPKALTAADVFPESDENYLAKGERTFEVLSEGRYRFTLKTAGVTFEVDRLRREHNELIGELIVRCELAGARTIADRDDGRRPDLLSTADFNFSSLRARQDRAKHLRERARTKDDAFDWLHTLEDFVQRVHAAERAGQPSILLRDAIPATTPDEMDVDGFYLLRRNSEIWFADGGTSKSYLALYVASRLAQMGVPTLFADWEMQEEDQRERLERLFGSDMPAIHFARCDKPLVDERDRLQRIIRDNSIQYIVIDSIGVACGGPPESAEFANRFMLAVRQLGIGSLLIAHVNKSDTGDRKPFGSSFWHNNARSTWFIQQSEDGSDERRVLATMFHRKSSGGPLHRPIGYQILFHGERAEVTLVNAADVPGAAEKMTISQRMTHALKGGRRTVTELASELDVDSESIRTTAKRTKQRFSYMQDAKGVFHIGLVDRRYQDA
jgi:hypothetical protein